MSLMEGDMTIVKTTCGHYFHNNCLATWFKGGHYNCPYCRTAFTKKQREMFSDTITIVPDNNAVRSMRRVQDESSQNRRLTEQEIARILHNKDLDEDKYEYAVEQLRNLTYDKKYRNLFNNTVSANFAQQARDKIDAWIKDGSFVDDRI